MCLGVRETWVDTNAGFLSKMCARTSKSHHPWTYINGVAMAMPRPRVTPTLFSTSTDATRWCPIRGLLLSNYIATEKKKSSDVLRFRQSREQAASLCDPMAGAAWCVGGKMGGCVTTGCATRGGLSIGPETGRFVRDRRANVGRGNTQLPTRRPDRLQFEPQFVDCSGACGLPWQLGQTSPCTGRFLHQRRQRSISGCRLHRLHRVRRVIQLLSLQPVEGSM